MKASAFYSAGIWELGTKIAGRLPAKLGESMARWIALSYCLMQSNRRRIVTENLLPALDGDRREANRMSRELFMEFGRKVYDLWRFEAGIPIRNLFTAWSNWDQLENAIARRKGTLLITPHLGNWEFGAPLLIEKNIDLHVVSLAEPDARLTVMRQKAREKWGIKTLVVGDNPFAFVDIIRVLDSGGTVALLIDRPPIPSAVPVQLFGRRFAASIAAAELARASGCALVPVYIPRTPQGYTARVLPEIAYDRQYLGKRHARQELTQEIVRAFEPVIQEYLTQWYHFVPIWKEATTCNA